MNLVEFRNFLYRIKTNVLYKTSSPLGVLRRKLWKPAGVYDGVYEKYRSSYPCFENFCLHGVDDPQVVKRYLWENKTYNYQSDIVFKVDADVYLEPTQSLGLMRTRLFVEETKSRAHKYLLPHPWRQVELGFLKKASRLDEAVLFDGYASKNHYHFFDDALNPLLMMIEQGFINDRLPIVYNHRLDEFKWFIYFKGLPELAGLNWRRQEPGEWIVCNSLYKGVATKKRWGEIYKFVGGKIDKNANRRIFVERKAIHARSFSNKSEIYAILKKYGFDIVVLDDMSYLDQIRLFASAKYIVAHHGAGLANLLYCDAKDVRLMELFSKDLLQPHYYWVAEEIGVRFYDAILGSAFDVSFNYRVDPALFERKLSNLISQ